MILTKTPLLVAAKRLVLLEAKSRTELFVNPVLIAFQFEPLSVERYTPYPVPAKRYVLTALID